MPDLLATPSPDSRGGRVAVIPMEVIEVSSPLDETLAMEMAAPPSSTLAKVGDATLPPLPIDEPNTGIALTPDPHAEAFGAMSSSMVDWHGGLIGIIFGQSVGERYALPAKEAGAKIGA